MFVGNYNTLWICKGSRIKIGRIVWYFQRIKCPDPLECKYADAVISGLYGDWFYALLPVCSSRTTA